MLSCSHLIAAELRISNMNLGYCSGLINVVLFQLNAKECHCDYYLQNEVQGLVIGASVVGAHFICSLQFYKCEREVIIFWSTRLNMLFFKKEK